MKILLANPRGFCAGVDRAIEIVERALDSLGAPIYVRHEVVHNRFVVDGLRDKGAVFIDEVHEAPDGATLIFSAHGVSKQVADDAAARDLTVFDATCPLVTKVHMEVVKYGREGFDAILIGHAGHPEVEGTMGRFEKSGDGQIHLIETVEDVFNLEVRDARKLAYVTQTTLSVDDTADIIDALREKFPDIAGPRKDDICYATQNRQDAVRDMSAKAEVLLVVGSRNSSNSNRLRELAEKEGAKAYLIDGADDIDRDWVNGCETVAVTAGASAPEVLVQSVVDRLREWGGTAATEVSGREETVVFSIPKALRNIPVVTAS